MGGGASRLPQRAQAHKRDVAVRGARASNPFEAAQELHLPQAAAVRGWDPARVSEELSLLGLSAHAHAFVREGIDGATLLLLGPAELDELGVPEGAAREWLLQIIRGVGAAAATEEEERPAASPQAHLPVMETPQVVARGVRSSTGPLLPIVSFVPGAVALQCAVDADPQGQTVFEGALLHCDLRGFVRLAEQQQAEDIAPACEDIFGAIVAMVTQCGGDVLKLSGEGVVSLFGDARTQEPAAALAAVTCGLAVHKRSPSFLFSGVSLTLHLAVVSGLLAGVHVTGDAVRHFLVLGRGVDDPAPCLAASQRGQLVVPARVWQNVSGAVLGRPIEGDDPLYEVMGLVSVVRVERRHGAPEWADRSDEAFVQSVSSYVPPVVREELGAKRVVEGRLVRCYLVALRCPSLHLSFAEDGRLTAESFAALTAAVERFSAAVAEGGGWTADVNLTGNILSMLGVFPPEADALHAASGLDGSVGVAMGEVFRGTLGSDERRDLRVLGDAVTRAELLAKVAAGAALCDDAAREAGEAATAAGFASKSPAPLRRPGQRKAVVIHKLRPRDQRHSVSLTASATAAAAAGTGTPHATKPLCGRDAELARIVGAGPGSVVHVTGDAGSGKSHLLRALRDRYGDAQLLYAPRSQEFKGLAYGFMRGWLRRLLGATPQAVLLQLLALGSEGEELLGSAFVLGAVLDVWLGDPPAPVSPSARPMLATATVTQVLRCIGPAVLLLDDLHDADGLSLDMLNGIIGAGLPELRVVVTGDPAVPPKSATAASAVAQFKPTLVVELGPLAPAALRQALSLSPETHDDARVEAICRAASGNVAAAELVIFSGATEAPDVDAVLRALLEAETPLGRRLAYLDAVHPGLSSKVAARVLGVSQPILPEQRSGRTSAFASHVLAIAPPEELRALHRALLAQLGPSSEHYVGALTSAGALDSAEDQALVRQAVQFHLDEARRVQQARGKQEAAWLGDTGLFLASLLTERNLRQEAELALVTLASYFSLYLASQAQFAGHGYVLPRCQRSLEQLHADALAAAKEMGDLSLWGEAVALRFEQGILGGEYAHRPEIVDGEIQLGRFCDQLIREAKEVLRTAAETGQAYHPFRLLVMQAMWLTYSKFGMWEKAMEMSSTGIEVSQASDRGLANVIIPCDPMVCGAAVVSVCTYMMGSGKGEAGGAKRRGQLLAVQPTATPSSVAYLHLHLGSAAVLQGDLDAVDEIYRAMQGVSETKLVPGHGFDELAGLFPLFTLALKAYAAARRGDPSVVDEAVPALRMALPSMPTVGFLSTAMMPVLLALNALGRHQQVLDLCPAELREGMDLVYKAEVLRVVAHSSHQLSTGDPVALLAEAQSLAQICAAHALDLRCAITLAEVLGGLEGRAAITDALRRHEFAADHWDALRAIEALAGLPVPTYTP